MPAELFHVSFLSILKNGALDIGKALLAVAGVGQQIAPLVTAVDPPLGALIAGAAITIEALIPGAKQGAARKPVVQAIVTANAPGADAAMAGKKIDDAITALNWIAELEKESPGALQVLLGPLGGLK